MEKFKFLTKKEISKLTKKTGVYALQQGKGFLYIGKANNIKERVKSHFQKSNYRDNLFINKVNKIGYIKTGSEIEAMILEANLIKKYRPKYNVIWRDDKNYFFVGITKQNLPRIFITHQIRQKTKKDKTQVKYIGPFVNGTALKKTLKTLRRIFPYYTVKKHPKQLCPWCHLGLCPGPDTEKKEYKKDIKHLISVLKGKSKTVLINLKKQMKSASNLQDYEKAAKVRDQMNALQKTLSNARIFGEIEIKKHDWKRIEKELKKILKTKKRISKIEAYDISNIQGQKATGSMITFVKGKPDTNLYRRFKIKVTGKPNDIIMIKEVLNRRLKHSEWDLPDLILIDGGKAQLNIVSQCLLPRFKQIRVMALAKKKNELYIENQKKPVLLKNLPREIFNLVLQLRDEAHRFAITYHKKLRLKGLLN